VQFNKFQLNKSKKNYRGEAMTMRIRRFVRQLARVLRNDTRPELARRMDTKISQVDTYDISGASILNQRVKKHLV
jgi:hypothetical protein